MELLRQYITTLWPQWQWDSFLLSVSAASLGFPLDPIPDAARAPLGFRHPLTGEPFSPTVVQRLCRELITRIRDFGPQPGAHTEAIQWGGYHTAWSTRVQSRWWENHHSPRGGRV